MKTWYDLPNFRLPDRQSVKCPSAKCPGVVYKRQLLIYKNFFLDWPQLPPLPSETEEESIVDHITDSSGKNRNPSGPRAEDPYANDESSAMLPIFVAIGAFIPLVFCMCKL